MMNMEVLSPVSAPWLRKGGPASMGFDGLIDHSSRSPFSSGSASRLETVSWLQLADREVVKASKSWHDISSTFGLAPLKPPTTINTSTNITTTHHVVKNLMIHVGSPVAREKGLYENEGFERYCSKFEDASLIPGIPDDVAKTCLALIPREDFSSIRRVCKAWWDHVQTREFYHTRKGVGTLEEWLYVLAQNHRTRACQWEVLSPITKEWKALPQAPVVKEGSGTIVFNEKLMVIGGVDPSVGKGPTAEVSMYDPVLDRWVKGASLNTPRSQFGCGVVDGKLYVVGGSGADDERLSSMEVYDPERDEWTRSANLRKSRWSCFAAGVGGKLYVMGGRSSFTLGNCRSIDVFDPKTGNWTELKNGCQMVLTHAVINDKIYCLEWKDERSLKVYNTADNTWTRILLPLPSNMRTSFCLGTVGGKLWLFPNSKITSETLVYNPEAARGSEWQTSPLKASGPCFGCAALTA
ncbi:hypothetical protein MPTK1_7g08240 [Marchantia polymorpha subsp. ruderalis]|nr:hypothetical protein MARPO_0146s0024 [Marchantia polymorpha]BBN16655.1 hypothetical protein Mp_7g08240 [Marchantia polymorpha subsp. ruderalis]|eukprot:PTQ29202.1 hypothetical protein MARPO_0146s0024 [Marchantia polymorpha]